MAARLLVGTPVVLGAWVCLTSCVDAPITDPTIATVLAATALAPEPTAAATVSATPTPDHGASAYPPPRPTPEPTATLDARSWNMTDDRVSELLRELQSELAAGDTVALAARAGEQLSAFPAGIVEGGASYTAEDVRRLLEHAIAAGSTPYIDGIYRAVFGSTGSLCLGIVTRGWQSNLQLPTPEGEHTYGQRMPEAIPAAWWGWSLCNDGGGDRWWWEHWTWFSQPDERMNDDEMRTRTRRWLENARWSSGDRPATWADWPIMPTYWLVPTPVTRANESETVELASPESTPSVVESAISVADAERHAFSYAIAEVDRRIEHTLIASSTDLSRLLDDDRLVVTTTDSLYDCYRIGAVAETPEACIFGSEVTALDSAAVIVMLVSDKWLSLMPEGNLDSVLGIDADRAASGGRFGSWRDPRATPESSERKQFVMYFDAVSGDYLGAQRGTHVFTEAVALRPPLPSVHLKSSGKPMATPTPLMQVRPTPLPLPAPFHGRTETPWHLPTQLPLGKVPASLLPVAEALPIVRGASWTYRRVSLTNEFHWSSRVRTVSVETSEQLAPDVVRSTLAFNPETGRAGPYQLDRSAPYWYLFPDGAASQYQPSPLSESDGILARQRLEMLVGDVAQEDPDHIGLMDTFFIPMAIGGRRTYGLGLVGFDDIDTPAGRFTGCGLYHRIYSARVTAAQWLCPGVGFVRSEVPMLGSMWGSSLHVEELVAFDIPDLEPVP